VSSPSARSLAFSAFRASSLISISIRVHPRHFSAAFGSPLAGARFAARWGGTWDAAAGIARVALPYESGACQAYPLLVAGGLRGLIRACRATTLLKK
jgi:hypothetical protein